MCIVLLVHILPYQLISQEITPSITCSGGETFIAEGYSLDFVIGESISESHEMQQTMLTQGFLQDIAGPTAISEIKTQLALNLYPNPANHFISIDVENNAIIKWYEIVSIYGISNEKTYCERSLTNIDISSLKPGIYLLKLGIENHDLIIKRFLKK